MGQTVELEAASYAVQPGIEMSLEADASTEVSPSRRRKALWLFNNQEEETIWVRFDSQGASDTTAMPLPAGSGIIIKNYHGALSAWSEKAGKLHVAEF